MDNHRRSKVVGFYHFQALTFITPLLVTLLFGFSVLELTYLAGKLRNEFISSGSWYTPSSKHRKDLNAAAQSKFVFDSAGFPVKVSGFWPASLPMRGFNASYTLSASE